MAKAAAAMAVITVPSAGLIPLEPLFIALDEGGS